MTNLAEIVSLVLTWPTLILGCGVLWHWGGEAWRAWRVPGKDRSGVQWLIVGVLAGFLGEVLDNTYWGIAWSMQFIESQHAGWWFTMGVWPNIPFRQCASIYAGYCHMRSFYSAQQQTDRKLTCIVLASALLGLVYIGLLTYFKESHT